YGTGELAKTPLHHPHHGDDGWIKYDDALVLGASTRAQSLGSAPFGFVESTRERMQSRAHEWRMPLKLQQPLLLGGAIVRLELSLHRLQIAKLKKIGQSQDPPLQDQRAVTTLPRDIDHFGSDLEAFLRIRAAPDGDVPIEQHRAQCRRVA